ncbi:hypothetical protein DH09_20065 [Bacillaceae bacterium JMAK1]|nr:hypothetical protein DH09_20065 [Bacillaceae bacterium JMAK1]
MIFVASELGLSVIDLTSYQLIAQTPVPAGGRFIHQIGYNPSNNTVYTGADFKVFGFDPDNNYQLSTTIDVPQTGGTGGRFTLNPLTSRGYVPISFVENVYTLDLITNT